MGEDSSGIRSAAPRLVLKNQDSVLLQSTLSGPVEVGRRRSNEVQPYALVPSDGGRYRMIVADHDLRTFPRSLTLLEPESNGNVRVTNLHESIAFDIENLETFRPQSTKSLTPPFTIVLPSAMFLEVGGGVDTSLDRSALSSLGYSRPKLRLPSENLLPLSESVMIRSSARVSIHDGHAPNKKQATLSDWQQVFLELLDRAMVAMQQPATSPKFFSGIAEATTRIIEFDRAEVLLWDGQEWQRDLSRGFVSDTVESTKLSAPSPLILDRALKTKGIVIFPDSEASGLSSDAIKVGDLLAAVACPLLEENGEVIGMLYADRISGSGYGRNCVTEVEEKFIEILATAISGGIARAKREQLVVKYQQFFSPKVTDAIRKDPRLLDGEECTVTVLFCDIRGFSRITDRIGTAKAMEWVQETLSALSKQVLDLDGVLVDYVGDELFAMWGAPEKSPDHAFRAASAAQQMMQLTSRLSQRWQKLIPEGVDFGIGLCTGRARVGNTGSEQKFKYGPMGRTVNLGSRIQGLTKHWKVRTLMDETTANSLSPDMLRRRICRAQVVGMDGDVELYELMLEGHGDLVLLKSEYEKALEMYESGNHLRASRAFGDLAEKFPNDGPSLMMLVRAVKELADPSEKFNPVWTAPNK